MRIACPACTAEYEVPDHLLAGSARSLRCSRCAAVFPLPRVEPEPKPKAEPEPPAVAAPPPEPLPLPADSVPDRVPLAAEPGPGKALLLAWTASLAVVLGAGVALVVFRGPIMAAWPPATRFFQALGLA